MESADAYPTRESVSEGLIDPQDVQTYIPGEDNHADRLRLKIDEYLSGMAAVRDGVFDLYFIELDSDGKGITVTRENVDAHEQLLRTHFADLYPDLAVSDEAAPKPVSYLEESDPIGFPIGGGK